MTDHIQDFWLAYQQYDEREHVAPLAGLDSAIHLLQARLPFAIPPTVREWIGTHIGGPVGCSSVGFLHLQEPVKSSLIDEVFGWGHSEAIVSAGLIPIAYDEAFGSYVCVRAGDEQLFMLDHETPVSDSQSNLRPMNRTFGEYLTFCTNEMRRELE